jgi:transcriptional regulator with XRE-family HTH domain
LLNFSIPNFNDMSLGKKIRVARVIAGLTQEELARKVHKTRPLISLIERDGKGNPDTINKILEVLNINTYPDKINDFPLYYTQHNLNNGLSTSEEVSPPIYEHLRREIDFLRHLVLKQQQIIQSLSQDENH